MVQYLLNDIAEASLRVKQLYLILPTEISSKMANLHNLNILARGVVHQKLVSTAPC